MASQGVMLTTDVAARPVALLPQPACDRGMLPAVPRSRSAILEISPGATLLTEASPKHKVLAKSRTSMQIEVVRSRTSMLLDSDEGAEAAVPANSARTEATQSMGELSGFLARALKALF